MPPKKKPTLEVSDPTTTSNNGIPSKKSTPKPAAKKGRKKKYSMSTPVKQRSLFSLHEKKQFLKALKEEGFSVINTPQKLTKYITDRPLSEIRQMIALYTRKCEERQRQEGEYSVEDSPLQSWNYVFQDLLSSAVRKGDFSVSIFPQILDEIGDEYASNVSNCDNSVKYGEIYKYLAQIMRAGYPPELEAKEAAAVIALMSATQECLEAMSTGAEMKFLSSGSWWSSDDETNLETEPTAGDNTSTAASSTGNALTSSTTSEGTNESEPNETENIEAYLNLPRMKKISDCVNPLKVPVSLLKEEHHRLSLIASIMETAVPQLAINYTDS